MLETIFEPDDLIAAAIDSAESEDLWGESWREPFERLCRSIAGEAGLYPARAWRIARWLLEILETRARIAAHLEAHGEAIAAVPIRRPIIITGLPRTGTTLLHNLLAGLPGLRAYTPWEMRGVVPEADAGDDWRDELRADTAAEIRAIYERSPQLARIHPIDADAPDECHWLTRHSFASLIFGYTLAVPSFVAWLLRTPQPQVYAEHRTQLQILGEREGDGRRLVLKDPGHLWHLGELLDTYPDALIVRLHRDPCDALPSLCSLMHTLQQMDSNRLDPTALGPEVLEMVDLALQRERRLRTARGDDAFLDLEYSELVRDPIAAVRRICARAEHPLGEEGAAAVASWLGANPKGKAGPHAYTAARFGLDAATIRERLGARG